MKEIPAISNYYTNEPKQGLKAQKVSNDEANLLFKVEDITYKC